MVGTTGLKGEYAHPVESVSLNQNDSHGSVYLLLATTSNQVNSSILLSSDFSRSSGLLSIPNRAQWNDRRF